MESLDHILDRLKAFAATRPVAYGVPACAFAGLLAGIVLQTGPQDAPYAPEMERVERPLVAEAEPIAWPAGDAPDYVIGTDTLKAARTPPPAIEYADYAPPPAPELPPYVPAEHGPATPPPAPTPPMAPSPDEPRWASARGDILDVSLPEDALRVTTPTVLAGIAP